MPTFQITIDDEDPINRDLQTLAASDGVSPETLIHRAVAAYLDARMPVAEPPEDFKPTNLKELFEGQLGKKEN